MPARIRDFLHEGVPHRTRRRIALSIVNIRRVTAAVRTLPSFLIIGVQRGGTSSLFRYLSEHPQIRRSIRKEVEYFTRDYAKGDAWYRAHFPMKLWRGQAFEASPNYLLDPRAPGRVSSLLPEIRVIVLLRDPIARAWSHYRHMIRLGREPLDFLPALAQEPARIEPDLAKLMMDVTHRGKEFWDYSYSTRGDYAKQLRGWFSHFRRDQFLIHSSEEFYRDPGSFCQLVAKWLDLDPYSATEFKNWSHPNGREPTLEMPRDACAFLDDRFRLGNTELAGLLEREFVWQTR